jgi:hypothetical protein
MNLGAPGAGFAPGVFALGVAVEVNLGAAPFAFKGAGFDFLFAQSHALTQNRYR